MKFKYNKLWENYLAIFRSLVTSGWEIYRTDKSIIRTWVYSYCSLPTKFKMKEANEINVYADKSIQLFGSSTRTNIHCNIFYDTKTFLNRS